MNAPAPSAMGPWRARVTQRHERLLVRHLFRGWTQIHFSVWTFLGALPGHLQQTLS
jgi:hypothetical protein